MAGSASAFHVAFTDYRFWPAFEHILEFMAIWLVSQTLFVVGLVLMLHNMAQRVGAVFRFLFYIPGALAGAASVIVWLFMLDPTASPFAFVLHWFGYAEFDNTIAPGNLPAIFAMMAFWTGAGGWIVVMYGALNNIPHELIEAAQIDGANAFQTALLDQASADPKVGRVHADAVVRRRHAAVRRAHRARQRRRSVSASPSTGRRTSSAWFVASEYNQFNEAAAISVILLVLGLVVAALLVWRGRLFEVE